MAVHRGHGQQTLGDEIPQQFGDLVDAAMPAHPAVAESAVIGVPSDVGEEEVMVFAVPAGGATLVPADLIAFLVDRLPHFMVPRFVAVVDTLPKTPTEKVRKHLLRDEHAKYQPWDRQEAVNAART